MPFISFWSVIFCNSCNKETEFCLRASSILIKPAIYLAIYIDDPRESRRSGSSLEIDGAMKVSPLLFHLFGSSGLNIALLYFHSAEDPSC